MQKRLVIWDCGKGVEKSMGYRNKANVIKILRATMPCLKIMEFPVKRIGLFGSVAREEDRMDSDIDIMLV